MKHLHFSKLFNELRLKAGFESLADFGKALAQEGYVYEDSTFSRWKTGNRMPRHPRLIAAMVKIFCEHHAFETKEQINEFYDAVGVKPPAYIYKSDQNSNTQVEELALFLLEEILGKPFVKLHHHQLKQYYELAHSDLRKFIALVRAIHQSPQNYIHLTNQHYLSRETYYTYGIYIKKHVIVSKSDATVMAKYPTHELMYIHANTNQYRAV